VNFFHVIGVIKSRSVGRKKHYCTIGQARNANSISVGESAEIKPSGKSRSKWKFNIKSCLKEIGHESTDWNYVTRERV
jgi:hypothetical protein